MMSEAAKKEARTFLLCEIWDHARRWKSDAEQIEDAELTFHLSQLTGHLRKELTKLLQGPDDEGVGHA